MQSGDFIASFKDRAIEYPQAKRQYDSELSELYDSALSKAAKQAYENKYGLTGSISLNVQDERKYYAAEMALLLSDKMLYIVVIQDDKINNFIEVRLLTDMLGNDGVNTDAENIALLTKVSESCKLDMDLYNKTLDYPHRSANIGWIYTTSSLKASPLCEAFFNTIVKLNK